MNQGKQIFFLFYVNAKIILKFIIFHNLVVKFCSFRKKKNNNFWKERLTNLLMDCAYKFLSKSKSMSTILYEKHS